MRSFIFGHGSSGLPILGYQFGSEFAGTHPLALILGGVHGNEVEGVVAANGLLEHFAKSFAYELRVVVVPAFNVDGVLAQTRVNGKDQTLLTLLLPNPPSPFTGPLIYVPKEDVVPLSMTVEDAVKFIVSGGVVAAPLGPANRASQPEVSRS